MTTRDESPRLAMSGWHRVTSTFDRCEVRVYVHGKRQP